MPFTLLVTRFIPRVESRCRPSGSPTAQAAVQIARKVGALVAHGI